MNKDSIESLSGQILFGGIDLQIELTSLWRILKKSDPHGQAASIPSRIEIAQTTVRKRCRIFGRPRNWRMIRTCLK